MFTDFKILTPAKWTINLYWSNPSQLKCLALLSCDLSLLKHISYYRQFSYIYILLGSVATCLRCGWIFKYGFVANLPVSLSAKEFWKSVDIWGSYGQKFSVLFFDSRRSYQVNDLLCRKSLSTYTYCIDTHTQTQPSTVRGPLKWSINSVGCPRYLTANWGIDRAAVE